MSKVVTAIARFRERNRVKTVTYLASRSTFLMENNPIIFRRTIHSRMKCNNVEIDIIQKMHTTTFWYKYKKNSVSSRYGIIYKHGVMTLFFILSSSTPFSLNLHLP